MDSGLIETDRVNNGIVLRKTKRGDLGKTSVMQIHIHLSVKLQQAPEGE